MQYTTSLLCQLLSNAAFVWQLGKWRLISLNGPFSKAFCHQALHERYGMAALLEKYCWSCGLCFLINVVEQLHLTVRRWNDINCSYFFFWVSESVGRRVEFPLNSEIEAWAEEYFTHLCHSAALSPSAGWMLELLPVRWCFFLCAWRGTELAFAASTGVLLPMKTSNRSTLVLASCPWYVWRRTIKFEACCCKAVLM